MKVRVFADLHLEFAAFTPPAVAADTIVLAGDTDVGLRGLEWARATFRDQQIIYVLGNHELYGTAVPDHIRKMRDAADVLRIHFLENDLVVFDDAVFMGCTLWTDFRLSGNAPLAALIAEQQVNDFKRIRVAPSYHKLKAADTIRFHRESVGWLRKMVLQHAAKKIVVISHHAPDPRSVPDRFRADVLSAAFASDLNHFIEESGIRWWFHGHIHDSAHYEIGSTKIICNPRGYPCEVGNGFDPGLIVEI